MGGSSNKKDEESRRKAPGEGRKAAKRRERELEQRLLAALESRQREGRARDADLLAALRASAAAQLSPAELELRLDALRGELERALEERITRRWASEGARLETLARRLEEQRAPQQVASAPASAPSLEVLMGTLEERLRSAREQDLRHREALFGRALRWVGLPLAVALVVLGAVGLKALADLRAVASAVAGRATPQSVGEPTDESMNQSMGEPAEPPDREPTRAPLEAPADQPAPPEQGLAALARRTPSHPDLARALDSTALEACATLTGLAPLAALVEPLSDAPADESEDSAAARRAFLSRLLARALREPFRFLAIEGDGAPPRLAIGLRDGSPEFVPLGDVLEREAFQGAVDQLLREAATQPTLAALRARVERLTAPRGAGDPRRGERPFVLHARLGEGAAAVPIDGAPIETGEIELTILPGDTGARLAIRRASTTEAWRPLRFLERPERFEYRLVPLDAD